MTLPNALDMLGGYNAVLVAVGSMLLGIAAGIAGTFLFLRKRALLGDAVAHAALPGVCIAFVFMAALGGDGRNLAGLLLGSFVTATLGLHIVQRITRRTRLREDVAIGAVLSVSFGIGIVLLTVIQNLGAGKPAGLETFLLGSTAGMLLSESLLIAAGGALVALAVYALRRPMAMVAFDPVYAASVGIHVGKVDWAMMTLVTAVTIVGLKIVGLILIVALLIIPPVAARFWTERTGTVVRLAGLIGGAAGLAGAAISASMPALPTGPIIVLAASVIFVVSLLFAPARGVVASMLRRSRSCRRIKLQQGLLLLAQGRAVQDRALAALLRKEGCMANDGRATALGMDKAVKALVDERRAELSRRLSLNPFDPSSSGPAESVSTGRIRGVDPLGDAEGRLAQPGEASA